jgi:ABC-type multidrug transport system permease subunit
VNILEKYKMKYNNNILESIIFFISSLLLLAYSLFNHYNNKNIIWKTSPYLFPVMISIIVFFLSLSLFNIGIKEKMQEGDRKKLNIHFKDVAVTILSTVVYYNMMGFTGFVIATILFLSILFFYFGERRIWLIVVMSTGVSTGIYVLFSIFLKVMLT